MLLNIKLGNASLPISAPLGAAVYYVDSEPGSDTASIVFGMQQPGESGIDAYNRITTNVPRNDWLPVAARPETQRPVPKPNADYIAYDFIYQNGQWIAANADVANFLRLANTFQTLPVAPPSTLAAKTAALQTRAKGRTK